MLKNKSKTKFKITLASCLLVNSLYLGHHAYANVLPKGTISINNVQLDKNMKVTSQNTGSVEAIYDDDLANYIVSIKKSETIDKLDLSEELNHDRIKIDSNFIIKDMYFPLEEVGKIIVNNSLQYITIESNKDNKHKFTVNIPDTQLFFTTRVGILEMFDKTLKKCRELDEILDEYTVTSLNVNNNRKPIENLLALKLDKDRVILRMRDEIDVKDAEEVVKRVSCDLADKKDVKSSCHRDGYMVLSNLKNSQYKGSRIINITKNNQPSDVHTDVVSDWTVIAVDKLSDGELDSSLFDIALGDTPIKTKDLNLCLHVTYNNKHNDKPITGTIDFIRIRNEDKSNTNKLMNMWNTGLRTKHSYFVSGFFLIIGLLGLLVYVIIIGISVKASSRQDTKKEKETKKEKDTN